MNKWKRLGIITMTILALLIVGCTTDGGNETEGDQSVGESLDYTIVGIEPGAGLMLLTEQALEDYDLDYDLQISSGAAMTQTLGDAIENEEPIVVTGWAPHWKFQQYDLKFLDDPLESFGAADEIRTIVREGLEEDHPEAFAILDNFYWETENMEIVMLEIMEGASPEAAGRQWVDDNQDLVSQWTDGVDEVNGDTIELAYTPWDSEIASANVMKAVLDDMGFDATITQVELGPMWTAVASGTTDATIAAWLPIHTEFYEDFQDDFVDLGANLEGARNGLVVPAYMDIDSIEDLADE